MALKTKRYSNKAIYSIRFMLLFFLLQLTACGTTESLKHTISAWQLPFGYSQSYTVKKGDTLYSIAFQYGKDYHSVASLNHLKAPYAIHPGQVIVLAGAENKSSKTKAKASKAKTNIIKKTQLAKKQTTIRNKNSGKTKKAHIEKGRNSVKTKKNEKNLKKHFNFSKKSVQCWSWPVKGEVVSTFNPEHAGCKGLEIAGRFTQPIKAAADGTVVYSGSGLRGYGNLIIIRHNEQYLSAYAYNKEMLVHEGNKVRRGQVIAKMGKTNAGRTMLHFEIRRNGKPVDPVKYLR